MVRLKPSKNYRYRIIICDQDGNVAFDDLKVHGKPMHRTLDRLVSEVIAKKCEIPNPQDFAFTHITYYCDEVEIPDREEDYGG